MCMVVEHASGFPTSCSIADGTGNCPVPQGSFKMSRRSWRRRGPLPNIAPRAAIRAILIDHIAGKEPAGVIVGHQRVEASPHMKSAGHIERAHRRSDILQDGIIDTIALIAHDPEDNTVALIDQLAARTKDPGLRDLRRLAPLSIDVDGDLSLTITIDLYLVRGTRLHNLEHPPGRLELANSEAPIPVRLHTGQHIFIAELHNRTLRPELIWIFEERDAGESIIIRQRLRPVHRERELLLNIQQADLLRLWIRHFLRGTRGRG